MALADDSVDEFMRNARALRDPQAVALHAIDSDHRWDAGADPVVTVAGTAADLLLMLYGRVPPEALRVAGDRAALDRFLEPME